MTEIFKTYWIIDDEKITSFEKMRRKVMRGDTAVEVSADSQQIAAEENQRRALLQAKHDEKIAKIAQQREHDQSFAGKAEAARRTALRNPGSIISGGMNPLSELDEYGPDRTNILR